MLCERNLLYIFLFSTHLLLSHVCVNETWVLLFRNVFKCKEKWKWWKIRRLNAVSFLFSLNQMWSTNFFWRRISQSLKRIWSWKFRTEIWSPQWFFWKEASIIPHKKVLSFCTKSAEISAINKAFEFEQQKTFYY